MYEIAELENADLVRTLGSDRVIITQRGYHYIRPPIRRRLNSISQHPIGVLGIIVTLIAIIVTLVGLSLGARWRCWSSN